MTHDHDLTAIERLTLPIRRLLYKAPAGGLVLLACAAIAMIWANSPLSHSYHLLWETPITLGVGGWRAALSLHEIVNDGLMAVFFFLVGLEIKREVLVGELASLRQAALPVAAAFGGMIVPALLFLAFNGGGEAVRGWGIPMATDIAFALGVLALLGDRFPPALRVFLSALAIADDLGAVLVIALFYTASVSWSALGAAASLLLLSLVANAMGVRTAWAYALIGIALWVAVLLSGVHATVAGVLLAMTIPSRTVINEDALLRGARAALKDFDDACYPNTIMLSNSAHQSALRRLEVLSEKALPPLARLEHGLHGIVTFGIMPLFALANAGVELRGDGPGLWNRIALGVLAGLVLGKPIGITLASWVAVRAGFATLPTGVTWRTLGGVAVLGGIGFTMSLFIAGLAFGDSEAQLTSAKIGTLTASLVAGVAGWTMLRFTRARAPLPPTDVSEDGVSQTPRTSAAPSPSP
ncbi:MAG TPA: Na+/H+ antiporter NhaA [Gemmatimonadaceae bacterium]|nr:Na+/H+ antiporter NhaA [Gemmatimonadaceae bacterium]